VNVSPVSGLAVSLVASPDVSGGGASIVGFLTALLAAFAYESGIFTVLAVVGLASCLTLSLEDNLHGELGRRRRFGR
jgi:hypothetical protein